MEKELQKLQTSIAEEKAENAKMRSSIAVLYKRMSRKDAAMVAKYEKVEYTATIFVSAE